jgi:uncharacterized protein
MKLSPDKINQLSRKMIEAITKLDEVEIFEDPAVIRQRIVVALNSLLRQEEEIDTRVRQQILSQKRTIPEGSAEWDILYRKYYFDALRKMGVVVSSHTRP